MSDRLNPKRILISGSIIALVAAVVIGATGAFFSDEETSTGNIFTAGSIDLKVDHTYASYNGEDCVSDCSEVGENLIVNGGFETPDIAPGTWTVYPDGTLTSWNVESGAGLEIQDHAAGNPHSGGQLGELDSNDSSAISQNIATVPGGHYKLRFWYSPRPNRPAGDNAIDYFVKVASNDGVILTGQVGTGEAGGADTSWTEYVYNFIAVDASTKIMFADADTSNSYGGYLDDISVRALDCTPGQYQYGGTCVLWNEKDLDRGDRFWDFTDIKPGDWGQNQISLHVYDNDAYVCLFPDNIEDDENTVVDPELAASDTTDDGVPYGELSGELEFFMWEDGNGNNQHDSGEGVLVPAGTPFNEIPTEIVQLSLSSPAPASLIGVNWCAGDQTGPQDASDVTPVSCDGSGMGNIAQTDKMVADFVAYAVQQRNNENFRCADLQPQS